MNYRTRGPTGITVSPYALAHPGTDVGTLDQAYVPPALQQIQLRRRPVSERSAA